MILSAEMAADRPTPFYFYDLNILRRTLDAATTEARRYGYHLHYALKANANPAILQQIRAAGIGADCVSGNEVSAAIEAGFLPHQTVLAGVGKSDEEIKTALRHEIFSLNVESLMELRVIQEIAASMGKVAPVALRVNPHVDAYTHRYITTGLEENKFGINPHEFDRAIDIINQSPNINLKGLHFHIGSQIRDLQPFRHLCGRAVEILRHFAGKDFILDHINLGGGLGVNYHDPDLEPIPDFASWFRLFSRHLQAPGMELHFEPGRALVAQCGTLVSRVLYIKEGLHTRFAILDAGMTELIRPALYQAFHKIENLSATLDEERAFPLAYDVVGPICESSDCFGKAVDLPETRRGDIMLIRSAGAYGEVMSSGYNLRSKVDTVVVGGR